MFQPISLKRMVFIKEPETVKNYPDTEEATMGKKKNFTIDALYVIITSDDEFVLLDH